MTQKTAIYHFFEVLRHQKYLDFSFRPFIILNTRGAGRYEKLVVLLLTIVLYVLDCQKIGGAIKGTYILSWQKLVVL